MSEIMKIIDLIETKKKKQKRKEKQRHSERVRAKWFCFASKEGFLQLICKASLIFKLNLELALPIILLERKLYESKHDAVECRYLRIWHLLSFLIRSLILILKWRQISPI